MTSTHQKQQGLKVVCHAILTYHDRATLEEPEGPGHGTIIVVGVGGHAVDKPLTVFAGVLGHNTHDDGDSGGQEGSWFKEVPRIDMDD